MSYIQPIRTLAFSLVALVATPALAQDTANDKATPAVTDSASDEDTKTCPHKDGSCPHGKKGPHAKHHGPHAKHHGPHAKHGTHAKHGPHAKHHGPHAKHHGPHAKHHGPHAMFEHHRQRQALLAQQNVCQKQNRALGQGPLGLTFQAGAFGATRRLCPRTEVGLVLRAPLTVEIGRELFVGLVGDVPDPVLDAIAGREQFFVNAAGGSTLAMSWAPLRRVELFLEIEALRAQFVRGSVTSTSLGFGHISPGATVVVSEGPSHAVGVTGRLQLPTATGFYKNTFPFLADVGAQVLVQPLPFLRLHSYLGASGGVALGPAADTRVGITAVAGAEVLPFDWLSFVADLNARALYDDTLDHLALSLGMRAAIFSTVGLEGGLLVPLAGSERALTALMFRATWRLGDLSVGRLMGNDLQWDDVVFGR